MFPCAFSHYCEILHILRLIVGVVQYYHIHIASYAEPAWIVAAVLAVVLHSYMYVITWNVCCCVWMNWPD